MTQLSDEDIVRIVRILRRNFAEFVMEESESSIRYAIPNHWVVFDGGRELELKISEGRPKKNKPSEKTQKIRTWAINNQRIRSCRFSPVDFTFSKDSKESNLTSFFYFVANNDLHIPTNPEQTDSIKEDSEFALISNAHPFHDHTNKRILSFTMRQFNARAWDWDSLDFEERHAHFMPWETFKNKLRPHL